MNFVKASVAQPITVAVGVLLALLAGLLSLSRVPVQMTPQVESVVISITTTWEGASAQEIETDVIEAQEQRLGNLRGLRQMTSTSQAGQGVIKLEYGTGTDLEAARTEVDLKLAEVPGYPEGVNKPVVIDADPDSVDYIAWVGMASTDPAFDPTLMKDFVTRRIVPRLERIPGVAAVGFLGGRDRELRVIADPMAMAQRGLTFANLVQVLRDENGNWSAGKLTEGKNDVRLRAVGRFTDTGQVEQVVLRETPGGQVLLRDVATVEVAHKERTDWVRARGHLMPYFNFQLETGANLLETMAGIDAEMAALTSEGGLFDLEARRIGIDGTIELVKSYDATGYVREALRLVQSNIFVGGLLATIVLLLFLRSFRAVGIVALAIPVSLIAGIAVFVSLGRTINIVSLAGMAFAVGMVVDNAIVVIENIYRHLESGKAPREAAVEGAQEVAGAVLASTLTTVVVFVPVLLIEDAAGQLFRDIALALVAAVSVSLVVSLTLIPSASAQLLRRRGSGAPTDEPGGIAAGIAATVAWLSRGVIRRSAVIVGFLVVTIAGILTLSPPLDYLPAGNRNIAFGLLIPPPAYSLDELSDIGERIEDRMRPFWEAAGPKFGVEERIDPEIGDGRDERHEIVDPETGDVITPPPIDDYFLVGVGGQMFHGAISTDPERARDAKALLDWSVSQDIAPDTFDFALQFPIFQSAGGTGAAVSIDLTGSSLDTIVPAAGALFGSLFGSFQVQPDPGNFNLPSPELRFVPRDNRLRQAGLSRRDLGLAVQARGDGILVPRQFEIDGELKDLKVMTPGSIAADPIPGLGSMPLAAPSGGQVDLGSVADIQRTVAPDVIKRVDRQRAVSLQLTPPDGMPLESALAKVDETIAGLRAVGAIGPDVEVRYAGSAGKLEEIKRALVGDGSFIGLLTSSLFLALFIVYLLMVVLFQSFLMPLVIMVSVPLATLGGFMGLALVHAWTAQSRYTPVQNLDVLTILGFVILAGVVVNNAILIVHQALRARREDGLGVDQCIELAVATRVRPIAMGALTSVGGMLPLVLSPGSGSELYRGLGAVIVGGLVVSTVFTLVLVPLLLSFAMGLRRQVT